MSIVIAILIFGLIVVIHELGHFIMARRCGVLVEEFSVGMGPLLYSWHRGDTQYSIRMLPIGGYCKMLGEDGSSGDPRAFNNKTMARRSAILVFGAVMNFLLAFVIFLFLVLLTGFSSAVVRQTVPDSPADKAGLLPGDQIVMLNNSKITIFEDLQLVLTFADGSPMDLTYLRNGQKYGIKITPYLVTENGAPEYKLGFVPSWKAGLFTPGAEGFQRADLGESLTIPARQIVFNIRATIISLVKLIIRQLSPDHISGIVGMVSTINDSYNKTIKVSVWSTFITMIYICGLISANLGVFNLLPLPALDGGRLLFILFELIRRKPVSVEKESVVHLVGFVLLMILAVFIAYSDIMKLL